MMAPLLVGFAGILLGGAALFFSFTGTGKTEEAQTNVEAMTAKAEGLETRLRDLEAKYSEQASKLSDAEQQLNRVLLDTNNAFKQVSVEINRNRDMIETSADKLTELIDTLNRPTPPRTSQGNTTTPVPTDTTPTPSEQLPVAQVTPTDAPSDPIAIAGGTRTHTIQSGDTFSQLSKQYNVSVAAILAANPDVDPRRLAVGQKIRIPAN